MKVVQNDGTTVINTFDEWEIYFRSLKGKKDQWKKKYSAYELANCWTSTQSKSTIVPTVYEDILKKHPDTKSFEIKTVIPEFSSSFDKRAGTQREHDLMIVCENGKSETLIMGVEAKVLEPFNGLIYEKLYETNFEKMANPKSKSFERIIDLCETILDINYNANKIDLIKNNIYPGILRYQLLYGLAGVLAEMSCPSSLLGGIKPTKCIFLIHQLIPISATPNELSKIAKNKNDLDNFTTYLFNKKLTAGILEGSYKIVGNTKSVTSCLKFKTPIEFYIGYIETIF